MRVMNNSLKFSVIYAALVYSYGYSLGIHLSRCQIDNGGGNLTLFCSPIEAERRIPAQTPQVKKLSMRLFQVCELCLAAYQNTHNRHDRFTVADIGCDHAQLSIGLLQNDIADNVIAIDRMKAPLERGRKCARAANVESSIDFRLGNGLTPLRTNDDVKVVCVAGVGSRCIVDILESHNEEDADDGSTDALRSLGVEHLVLQPVSPHPQYMIPLRRWLEERGWSIQNETIIKARKRSYLNILATDANTIRSKQFQSFSEGKKQKEMKIIPPRLSKEELVLSSPIRRRVHSSCESSKEELELWTEYVNEYRRWALSGTRSDTYDKDVGISRNEIASLFIAEEQALRNIIPCK